ncbi:LysE family transporter [bacterium]|nr:LysE family transporter [bacterium]
MTYYILFGITYALAAALQPGPLQTYIISQTLNKGWKATIATAFAPIISDIPIFIIVFFLLTKLPPTFLNVLRIIGGLFLFYLSYRTFNSWKHYSYNNNNGNSIGTFFNAVLVNLLNPNPYIGWSLIMGPMVLEAWNKTPSFAITLVVCFYLTMIISLIGLIFLFSYARSIGPKISRSLLGLSSIGLFIFGIYQLYRGITF